MLDITLPLFALQPETKEIPLSQDKVAVVDAADYDYLSQWKWYAHKKRNRYTFYAVRTIRNPEGKKVEVRMHRLILGVGSDTQVDHRDGNGLNNTRGNLRSATNQQNNCNKSVQANNTSGFKGVTFHKKRNKWQAQIKLDGKMHYLGLFATPEEAARAYDKSALELHGEFARLNPLSRGRV